MSSRTTISSFYRFGFNGYRYFLSLRVQRRGKPFASINLCPPSKHIDESIGILFGGNSLLGNHSPYKSREISCNSILLQLRDRTWIFHFPFKIIFPRSWRNETEIVSRDHEQSNSTRFNLVTISRIVVGRFASIGLSERGAALTSKSSKRNFENQLPFQ